MVRAFHTIRVLTLLDKYFPNPKIQLKHKDSYTLLIAVLLSAQSTDKRVNVITPILFAKADTPEKMSQLSVKEIEAIIKSCGLGPTKAKAIHALSKLLVKNHQGKVPSSLEELEKLPGVGHKTASVVLAQAFHKPAFPVDTHIHRCAKRWKLSDGKSVKKTEEDLKKLFHKNTWIKRHLQIILYAREYCPARGHIIADCPICKTLQQKEK